MVDAHFEIPRLAEAYDLLDADRSDLEAYSAIVDELGATRVLDIGCGTGALACMLACRGIDVIGLDPARAALDVSRKRPGGDRVAWVHGELAALPALQVDLATMTGNVAQVFLTDGEWSTTLKGCHRALRPTWSSRAACPRSGRGFDGPARRPTRGPHTSASRRSSTGWR